ncbi:TonB-dependent receptor plug domain-containing protein [Nibribacter ruber]|uniref:TonB-dependent receptor plug domain-containing protein n=1 Tax=Nibribacter ruber TaxID=2698458 RepID=A0A6P1P2L0_9BACT|nr:TonB-dependent receptor [Nibribacter ruber]QHL88613.1 TonB-dependent receptor plug domain-containing protein [Nibribacter ruber]
MRTFLLTLLLLNTAWVAVAQQGTLTGKVQDAKTGEPLIGAVVAVTGSSVATPTDAEGNFTLPLKAGVYSITATYVSYTPFTQGNLTIMAGQTTPLTISMAEDSKSLQEVTVVVERQTNSEMALIKDLRQSEVVVSGMSSEQIVKAQDRDAAEAVRRIPGVTIQDNRFIIVRGLSERYNSVLLNNALTPSSEVDVRAFSFDVLPTSVIDRILIYKSPAPELPGDFAGGAIKVGTKNTVSENSTSFNFSTSFRNGTTFQDFQTDKGSPLDFWGLGSGKRSLPGGLPATSQFQSLPYTTKAQYGQQLGLRNVWTPENTTASPDMRFNLGLNRLIDLADFKLSSVSALTYSNTRQFQNISRWDYQEARTGQAVETNWAYQDAVSSNTVRLGALQNFSLRLNENNKLEFRNLFNQIGINEATVREGLNMETGTTQEEQNFALRYESRTIYTGQLQGTHTSQNQLNTYTWTTGFNFLNRQEPDLRRVRTQRDAGSEAPYKVQISTNSTPYDAGRFFSHLDETAFIAEGQFQHLFQATDSADLETAPKFKAGFYVERKDRGFKARTLTYKRNAGIDGGRTDEAILNLPLHQIFRPENLNTSTGLLFDESTSIADKYQAANTLGAGYLAFSKTFFDRVNFYGGVRAEYNMRKVKTADQAGPSNVDQKKLYILPSLNTTYNFSIRSLVRLAYGMTVNRPEFREQARFSFYDFNENASVRGNPDLKTAMVHNADLRYEFYPTANELLSVGVFYKHFIDPIETRIETGAGRNLTFANGDFANSLGVEVEARKSFQEWSSNSFIQGHSLVLNASVIHSEVNLGDGATQAERKRPMMGQSPYIVNTGLYYQNEETGWQYSLLYNVLGERIYRVGNDENPSIYEMPRHVLDFTLTKNFKNGLQVKAGIQDLLNQKYKFVEDTDQDGHVEKTDLTSRTYTRGMYTTLGLGYTF